MKSIYLTLILAIIVLMTGSYPSKSQQPPAGKLQINPWTARQLLEPSALVSAMKSNKNLMVYNIGVMKDISGAINLGAASEKENLEKLDKVLKTVPKNKMIAVYCGCCPMDKCPNIRPAFEMLKKHGMNNIYLVNLPVNLKTDWTDKGYPMAKEATVQ